MKKSNINQSNFKHNENRPRSTEQRGKSRPTTGKSQTPLDGAKAESKALTESDLKVRELFQTGLLVRPTKFTKNKAKTIEEKNSLEELAKRNPREYAKLIEATELHDKFLRKLGISFGKDDDGKADTDEFVVQKNMTISKSGGRSGAQFAEPFGKSLFEVFKNSSTSTASTIDLESLMPIKKTSNPTVTFAAPKPSTPGPSTFYEYQSTKTPKSRSKPGPAPTSSSRYKEPPRPKKTSPYLPSYAKKGMMNLGISSGTSRKVATPNEATRRLAANNAGIIRNNNGESIISTHYNPRVKSATGSGAQRPVKTATQYFQERNIPHVPRGIAGISMARMATNMGRDVARHNGSIIRPQNTSFLRKSLAHYDNPAFLKSRAILQSSLVVPVHVPGPKYDNIYIGPYNSDSKEELLYRNSTGVKDVKKEK